MNEKHSDKEFATRAVWSGGKNIEGAASTPIFLTSTYQLTDERYQGWADGAQHPELYSRLSSINSEADAAKVAALEGAEDVRPSPVACQQLARHSYLFFRRTTTWLRGQTATVALTD